MVPTWPKMSQHPTNHKIQLKWLNKGKGKPQNTTKWPNMSPRSGKHTLTAACPKKETKKKQQKPSATESTNCIFCWYFGCFVQTPCMDENSTTLNAQVQNKGRHRSENSAKWNNMSPIWCQHGPKCPNIAQNGPR